MSEQEAMQEFSDWFKRSGWYTSVARGAAWEAWQASRAAVVVELPQCEYANAVSEYSKGHRQGVRACRDAIEAAGVRVAT